MSVTFRATSAPNRLELEVRARTTKRHTLNRERIGGSWTTPSAQAYMTMRRLSAPDEAKTPSSAIFYVVGVSVSGFADSVFGGGRPAADAKTLPQTEPGTVGEHLVVPSVGGSDVACAERPNVRSFEHFLQLLNVVNDAFNVHRSQYSESAVSPGTPHLGWSGAILRWKDYRTCAPTTRFRMEPSELTTERFVVVCSPAPLPLSRWQTYQGAHPAPPRPAPIKKPAAVKAAGSFFSSNFSLSRAAEEFSQKALACIRRDLQQRTSCSSIQ